MNSDTLFSLANVAVLPGWGLLIFLPRWRWTARLIAAVVIPAILAVLYAYLIAAHMIGAEGGFGSLNDVALLFRNRDLLLAGWVHYLAFDLFVGAWEVRDAQASGVHHLLVVPCLVLTFLLGPVGLLLYLVLRASLRKKIRIDEPVA